MALPKLEPKQTNILDVTRGIDVDLLEVAGRKLEAPEDFARKARRRLDVARIDLSPDDLGLPVDFGVRMHFRHKVTGLGKDGEPQSKWEHMQTHAIPVDRVIKLPDLRRSNDIDTSTKSEVESLREEIAMLKDAFREQGKLLQEANDKPAKRAAKKPAPKKTSPEDSDADLENELD